MPFISFNIKILFIRCSEKSTNNPCENIAVWDWIFSRNDLIRKVFAGSKMEQGWRVLSLGTKRLSSARDTYQHQAVPIKHILYQAFLLLRTPRLRYYIELWSERVSVFAPRIFASCACGTVSPMRHWLCGIAHAASWGIAHEAFCGIARAYPWVPYQMLTRETKWTCLMHIHGLLMSHRFGRALRSVWLVVFPYFVFIVVKLSAEQLQSG